MWLSVCLERIDFAIEEDVLGWEAQTTTPPCRATAARVCGRRWCGLASSARSEGRHLAGRLGIDSGAGNVGVACQQGRGSPRAAVSTLPTSRLAAISRSNVPQSNSRFSMIRLSDSLSGLIVPGKVALLGWQRVIHSTSARTITGVGHR